MQLETERTHLNNSDRSPLPHFVWHAEMACLLIFLGQFGPGGLCYFCYWNTLLAPSLPISENFLGFYVALGFFKILCPEMLWRGCRCPNHVILVSFVVIVMSCHVMSWSSSNVNGCNDGRRRWLRNTLCCMMRDAALSQASPCCLDVSDARDAILHTPSRWDGQNNHLIARMSTTELTHAMWCHRCSWCNDAFCWSFMHLVDTFGDVIYFRDVAMFLMQLLMNFYEASLPKRGMHLSHDVIDVHDVAKQPRPNVWYMFFAHVIDVYDVV